jgi:hypothetical protein
MVKGRVTEALSVVFCSFHIFLGTSNSRRVYTVPVPGTSIPVYYPVPRLQTVHSTCTSVIRQGSKWYENQHPVPILS